MFGQVVEKSVYIHKFVDGSIAIIKREKINIIRQFQYLLVYIKLSCESLCNISGGEIVNQTIDTNYIEY